MLDLFNIHVFDCTNDNERYCFLAEYETLVHAIIELDHYILKSILLPGTRAEKVSNLWHRMQQWYADHRPHNQLQTLTWDMIKKDAASPAKLKAKAAECRGLIRFGAALANGKTRMETLIDSLWHTS